ncbi:MULTISPECIES: hypothetical protein [Inquilinus]|jgi:hypothetical protein|uniref:Uncharacterized protein n=1 Tax=Inquilinus ginsengisoli TaxID=363840 RepID=A0ABU1JHW0_9PROT|nr:hypothetical protein [Inquilinus ginsengisoli]MDR6288202.1 hypothetical protein [Inquilinus ginsengisoli]
MAEHPFGAPKAWTGATHFLTRVSIEMSLQLLTSNFKPVVSILGLAGLLQAIRP